MAAVMLERPGLISVIGACDRQYRHVKGGIVAVVRIERVIVAVERRVGDPVEHAARPVPNFVPERLERFAPFEPVARELNPGRHIGKDARLQRAPGDVKMPVQNVIETDIAPHREVDPDEWRGDGNDRFQVRWTLGGGHPLVVTAIGAAIHRDVAVAERLRRQPLNDVVPIAAFVFVRNELALGVAASAHVHGKKGQPMGGEISPTGVEVLGGIGRQCHHRRHAACLALDAETEGGFRILAIVDAKASETRDLVLKMYRENEERYDLSAFEKGRMFARWLEQGLFAEQQELAAHVRLSPATVSQYLAVAELPDAVVEAFGDPRSISMRWMQALAAALKTAPAAVLANAARVAKQSPRPEPETVLKELIAVGRTAKRRGGPEAETVKMGGKSLYTISWKGSRVSLKFGKQVEGALVGEAQEALKQFLSEWLKKRVKS